MSSKYKQRTQISCLEDLLRQEYVSHHGKVLHRGWFMSWQIQYAINQIRLGTIYHVEKIDDCDVHKKDLYDGGSS